MTRGALDAGVVRRDLVALDEAVQRLRLHQDETEADLAAEGDVAWAVERGLQLCAQNALDIATHVVASTGRDVEDYASAIDRLGDLGVLPADFAARFRGVAGFRNVLVRGSHRALSPIAAIAGAAVPRRHGTTLTATARSSSSTRPCGSTSR
jgi:uncharacterized protein YutE (UPF0331/DUF86 family)